jgi:hypothetical protein
MVKKRWLRIFVLIGLLMLFASSAYAEEPTHGNVSIETLQSSDNNELSTKVSSSSESGEKHGSSLGKELPLWSVLPFVGILLSIAIFPLVLPDFWHHHYGKVAAAWALIFAIPFAIAYRGEAIYEMLHILTMSYFKNLIDFLCIWFYIPL